MEYVLQISSDYGRSKYNISKYYIKISGSDGWIFNTDSKYGLKMYFEMSGFSISNVIGTCYLKDGDFKRGDLRFYKYKSQKNNEKFNLNDKIICKGFELKDST